MKKHYPIVGRTVVQNKRKIAGSGIAPEKKNYEAEVKNQEISEQVQMEMGRGVTRRVKPLSYKF